MAHFPSATRYLSSSSSSSSSSFLTSTSSSSSLSNHRRRRRRHVHHNQNLHNSLSKSALQLKRCLFPSRQSLNPNLIFNPNNHTHKQSSSTLATQGEPKDLRPDFSPTNPEEQQQQEDVKLSDSYAAYCRAFTSSPAHLGQNSQLAPLPLPHLPTSGQDQTTEERGTVEAVSGIRFLPIGAHGYHPASWALPRPPTPPPGILTPSRYEEIQRRTKRETNQAKDKKRRIWTRCMPFRVSWLPWGRAKDKGG